MSTLLEVKNLTVSYGAIKALHDISFSVEDKEVITLIGSNGAGKTTTLHAVSNILKKDAGSVFFDGEDITDCAPDKIVERRLIQVPEGRRIFQNLSVRENLELGAYLRRDKAEIRRDTEKVFELFPRLKERLKQNAGTLSGGEQQMLAMGRALMAFPKLLLLDEPSMGLAPILVDEIFSIIKKISAEGTTILLVEQNAYKALSVADRAYILETGAISKSGKAADLAADPAVKAAYLGG
ncbi:ABC transporter, ATP-binding protein [Treponema socranskii subsp. socranskii VPI DR56BR1116 = ATCC 35536]|uniref:ABC transporter, ATP-binding protein n=1 Tax=Treponema socranskii subsp. socranskii VPI DR56BR1116 = ATCC 35536 TaxID=1125725 RepID=U2MMI8_TRESO|nr:ABC transporter, ATP-binding protein [Treponema socranskii subsp. socranskii VPI DR56BR1116 = ATCC 35536]ERK02870.1 ABC transporter, ATP-binding protein [Treponema socranskii subsp. socranskii VPI DR56BR1116 = ATCC 35536]